jgi:hypothetical protein
MNLTTLVIAILAVCGIVWVYPRLPAPFNLVLVAIVAVVCVLVLLSLSGTGLHF